MHEQKQTLGLNPTYDQCNINEVLNEMSKFTTENLLILFVDCIR